MSNLLRRFLHFALALITSFIGILTYETTKKWTVPHLSFWESNFLFVAFTTGIITLIWNYSKKKYTELKRKTEHEVSEIKNDLKDLFKEALTGDFITDAQGIIIDVNESFINIFGFDDVNEVLGKKISSFYPLQSENDRIRGELLAHGNIKNYVTTRKKKNGELINIIENISAKKDSNGNIIRIEGYIFDITQHVLAEKKVRESEEMFKTLNHLTYNVLPLENENEIYRYITNSLWRMFPDCAILSFSIDSNFDFRFEALEGIPVETGNRVIEQTGFNIRGINNKLKHIGVLATGELIQFENGLSEFDTLKEFHPELIQSIIGFNHAFGIGLNRNGHLMAAFIILTSNVRIKDEKILIETYVNHAAIILNNKEAEYELQRNKEKLKQTLSNSSDAIVLVTEDGNPIDIYPSFTRITGLNDKEITNTEKFKEQVHPEDRIKITEGFRNIKEKGNGEIRIRFKHKNGHWLKLELVGNNQLENPYLKSIIINIRDVTERQNLIEKWRESEERWKFALEGNQDGVWDWNMLNNEVFFSHQWKAMLGYSNDEISDNFREWESRVHPDDLRKCYDGLQNHLKGVIPFYSNIYRMLCKDGSYKWILDRGKVITYNEGNEPMRMIGTHTDLTEKIEQENQLKELNATKDKLFSIIAHDLRNPIGNIVNYSELLKNQYEGQNNKATSYLGIINFSARNTLILLEDLLLWAKSQRGHLEFKPEFLDIDSIFNEVIDLLIPLAIMKEILIENSALKDESCHADRQMLKTILRNLLHNAIKFTNAGGKIEISSVTENNVVKISISDNGIGIDEDTQKQLFRMTSTTSSQGTLGESGSGFGLTLCSEFVEKHGGKIWVESEVGKGSIFYFTLPSGR